MAIRKKTKVQVVAYICSSGIDSIQYPSTPQQSEIVTQYDEDTNIATVIVYIHQNYSTGVGALQYDCLQYADVKTVIAKIIPSGTDLITCLFAKQVELSWERPIIESSAVIGKKFMRRENHLLIKYNGPSDKCGPCFWRGSQVAAHNPDQINTRFPFIVSYYLIPTSNSIPLPPDNSSSDYWKTDLTVSQEHIETQPNIMPGELLALTWRLKINGNFFQKVMYELWYDTPLFTGGVVKAINFPDSPQMMILVKIEEKEIFCLPTDFAPRSIGSWVFLMKQGMDTSNIVDRESAYSKSIADTKIDHLDIFNLINEARENNGEYSIVENTGPLQQMAKNHADYMAEQKIVGHNEVLGKKFFTGETVSDRSEVVKYTTFVGENCGGVDSNHPPEEYDKVAFESWKNSPTHWDNILRSEWSEMAVEKTLGADGIFYYCQIFGAGFTSSYVSNYRTVPITMGQGLITDSFGNYDTLDYQHDMFFERVHDMAYHDGKIIEIDPSTATAKVEVIIKRGDNTEVTTTYSGVKIFYHCPASKNTDNGHLAFQEDDEVIVLNEGGRSPSAGDLTIIGFQGKLGFCEIGEIIVIATKSGQEAFAWDLDNDTSIVIRSQWNQSLGGYTPVIKGTLSEVQTKVLAIKGGSTGGYSMYEVKPSRTEIIPQWELGQAGSYSQYSLPSVAVFYSESQVPYEKFFISGGKNHSDKYVQNLYWNYLYEYSKYIPTVSNSGNKEIFHLDEINVKLNFLYKEGDSSSYTIPFVAVTGGFATNDHFESLSIQPNCTSATFYDGQYYDDWDLDMALAVRNQGRNHAVQLPYAQIYFSSMFDVKHSLLTFSNMFSHFERLLDIWMDLEWVCCDTYSPNHNACNFPSDINQRKYHGGIVTILNRFPEWTDATPPGARTIGPAPKLCVVGLDCGVANPVSDDIPHYMFECIRISKDTEIEWGSQSVGYDGGVKEILGTPGVDYIVDFRLFRRIKKSDNVNVDDLLSEINIVRQSSLADPFCLNLNLIEASKRHLNDMMNQPNDWSDIGTDDSTVEERIFDSGFFLFRVMNDQSKSSIIVNGEMQYYKMAVREDLPFSSFDMSALRQETRIGEFGFYADMRMYEDPHTQTIYFNNGTTIQHTSNQVTFSEIVSIITIVPDLNAILIDTDLNEIGISIQQTSTLTFFMLSFGYREGVWPGYAPFKSDALINQIYEEFDYSDPDDVERDLQVWIPTK